MRTDNMSVGYPVGRGYPHQQLQGKVDYTTAVCQSPYDKGREAGKTVAVGVGLGLGTIGLYALCKHFFDD